MYGVKFGGSAGLYGEFPNIEKATVWAGYECDGCSFTIHQLDSAG